MNTISLTLNENQLILLEKLYHENRNHNNQSPYVAATYRPDGCVITVYTSRKVVFQGKEAAYHAALFQMQEDLFDHAGSDEVGTGDFYGPICVCACIVKEKDRPLLDALHIRDSKTLNDDTIRQIAPMLTKNLDYSLLILDNEKYNEVQPENNMNRIKARMHNQAYVNLKKKVSLPSRIIIDQFTPEKSYYRYLTEEKEIIRPIHFETKAEDKYAAVACASIIAREAFLKTFDQMNARYQWEFVKGAGVRVDENAIAFVRKFGVQQLRKVAKLNFKNMERIMIG